MGIKLFSKKIYDSEIKKNKSFILMMTATIIFMYGIISIYYNENIYPNVREFKQISYWDQSQNLVEFEYPVEGLMRTNLFFILAVATAVVILCTFKYIREKSKNIACIMYSGGGYREAFKFLVYTSLKSFSIATILGVLIGILISPINNFIIYKIVQNEGSLFTFNLEGFLNVLLFIIIQFSTIVMINFGYIYRKDVMGLINIDGAKTLDDKRVIKIPNIIYIILYVLPLFYMLTFPDYKDAGKISLVLSIISMLVLHGFIKYGLDGIYRSLKKRKFMYKGTRILYISNSVKTIKESYVYILLLMLTMLSAAYTMLGVLDFTGMKEIILICIMGSSIVISLSVGYKFIVEAREIESRAKQIRLLGFSNESILSCVTKEIILTFTLTNIIPLMILASTIYIFTISGLLSFEFGASLILSILIPSNVIGVICSFVCKNKISDNLEIYDKKN